MKIHLFQQCLIDMFYPHVGMAGVEVLERLGCELVVPKKQVCCGQMFTNPVTMTQLWMQLRIQSNALRTLNM